MAQGSQSESGGDRALLDWLLSDRDTAVFAADRDGRLTLASPGWEPLTGWSPAELVSQPWDHLFHPEDEAGKRSSRRVRVRMKDGAWRWFEGPIQHLPDGRLFGSLRDATLTLAREGELAEARRSQRDLSKAAGIVRWRHDPVLGRIIWSEEFLALTGYDAGDINWAGDFRAQLHPDEWEDVTAIFQAAYEDNLPHTFEHRFRAKDGRWTTWRVTCQTELCADGGYALAGVSQDITELALARDAALKSERQSRQLIEASPFAVAMFDEKLRYMVASPRWREIFGLGSRDHLGLPLSEVSPNVPRRLLDARQRALKGEIVSSAEDQLVDDHGDRLWIRWEISPWRDASGEIAGMLAYINDISAMTQAREQAKENSRRLALALEAGEAGVYEIDHVKKTFWASPEFTRLTGYRTTNYEDALKLRFPRFHPDDRERARQEFRSAESGASRVFETRILKPDGEERWVRVFHQLQFSRSGRRLKAVGLVLDFDARKRQELALVEAERAAQAAGEAKAAFLANMSHEIRTPMNGVMGVLHLLKREALSEEGRRMLDEALSCGHMLAELLNDVIDFSKIEAGRLELSDEAIDPRALASGIVRLLAPQAEAKGLTLAVENLGDVGWVRADPVRLRQALFNLVGNAVKFTLKGGVVLRNELRQGPGGPTLRFEVSDTGVGIPIEAQPRIFQRFDQGDASTTRRFGGSGLGLSITKRLAEMMGGDVGFTSQPGLGSIFWLEVAAPPAAAAAQVAEAPEGLLEGLRILVVEDNPTNRMIATKLLENLGVQVETAADGLLGVEAAMQGAFDLILMDVQMPGIDGLEATRRIRQSSGASAQAPIVALTANVLAHQRQAYLAAGMNGVVGKPISPASLLAEIARVSSGLGAAEAAA